MLDSGYNVWHVDATAVIDGNEGDDVSTFTNQESSSSLETQRAPSMSIVLLSQQNIHIVYVD